MQRTSTRVNPPSETPSTSSGEDSKGEAKSTLGETQTSTATQMTLGQTIRPQKIVLPDILFGYILRFLNGWEVLKTSATSSQFRRCVADVFATNLFFEREICNERDDHNLGKLRIFNERATTETNEQFYNRIFGKLRFSLGKPLKDQKCEMQQFSTLARLGATQAFQQFYLDSPNVMEAVITPDDFTFTGELLTTAAREGHANLVKFILNKNIRIWTQRFPITALHEAVENKRHQVVKEFVTGDHALRTNTFIDGLDGSTYTPLMMAIKSGDKKMVEILLEAGASVNRFTVFNALHVCCQCDIDETIRFEIVDILLKQSPQLANKYMSFELTPLLSIFKPLKKDISLPLLRKMKEQSENFSASAQTNLGQNVFHFIARYSQLLSEENRLEVLNFFYSELPNLYDAIIDIDDGQTPLKLASLYRNSVCVSFFIEKHLSATKERFSRSFLLGIQQLILKRDTNSLHQIFRHCRETGNEHLIHQIVNPNPSSGPIIMWRYALRSSKEMIELFMTHQDQEKDLQPSIASEEKELEEEQYVNPFKEILVYGNGEAVSLFIQPPYCHENNDINRPFSKTYFDYNDNGELRIQGFFTPLSYAAKSKNPAFLKSLVEAKADPAFYCEKRLIFPPLFEWLKSFWKNPGDMNSFDYLLKITPRHIKYLKFESDNRPGNFDSIIDLSAQWRVDVSIIEKLLALESKSEERFGVRKDILFELAGLRFDTNHRSAVMRLLVKYSGQEIVQLENEIDGVRYKLLQYYTGFFELETYLTLIEIGCDPFEKRRYIPTLDYDTDFLSSHLILFLTCERHGTDEEMTHLDVDDFVILINCLVKLAEQDPNRKPALEQSIIEAISFFIKSNFKKGGINKILPHLIATIDFETLTQQVQKFELYKIIKDSFNLASFEVIMPCLSAASASTLIEFFSFLSKDSPQLMKAWEDKFGDPNTRFPQIAKKIMLGKGFATQEFPSLVAKEQLYLEQVSTRPLLSSDKIMLSLTSGNGDQKQVDRQPQPSVSISQLWNFIKNTNVDADFSIKSKASFNVVFVLLFSYAQYPKGINPTTEIDILDLVALEKLNLLPLPSGVTLRNDDCLALQRQFIDFVTWLRQNREDLLLCNQMVQRICPQAELIAEEKRGADFKKPIEDVLTVYNSPNPAMHSSTTMAASPSTVVDTVNPQNVNIANSPSPNPAPSG